MKHNKKNKKNSSNKADCVSSIPPSMLDYVHYPIILRDYDEEVKKTKEFLFGPSKSAPELTRLDKFSVIIKVKTEIFREWLALKIAPWLYKDE